MPEVLLLIGKLAKVIEVEVAVAGPESLMRG
jgi:hypothetical protein